MSGLNKSAPEAESIIRRFILSILVSFLDSYVVPIEIDHVMTALLSRRSLPSFPSAFIQNPDTLRILLG